MRHLQQMDEKWKYTSYTLLKNWTQHALVSHILRAHSAKKIQWTICSKALSSSSSTILMDHIATHTGASIYDCLYCHQKLKCSGNMYYASGSCKEKTEINIDFAMKFKISCFLFNFFWKLYSLHQLTVVRSMWQELSNICYSMNSLFSLLVPVI